MSLHGPNPVPVAFPTRQKEYSVADNFSILYASSSVCAHRAEVCGHCWLFAESQSSSKATDKATAGGWVAWWRKDRRGQGVTPGSMPLLITLLDSEEKAD